MITCLKRHTVALALAAGVAAAVLVSDSASAAGFRWPTRTLTYQACTPWPHAVRRAVWLINKAPSRLRLVRRACGSRADIRIKAGWFDEGWAGLAWYPPDGRVLLNQRYVGEAWGGYHALVETAVHELLHAVGLPHSGYRCDVMHPAKAPWDCPALAPEGQILCGVTMPALRQLVRRYGGRTAGHRPYCRPNTRGLG